MPPTRKRNTASKPAKETSKNSLDRYRGHLRCCKKKFPCPGCKATILPIQFEKHAKPCLNLDSLKQCVWCLGKEIWKGRSKGTNVGHLMSCFDACLFRKAPLPPPPAPSFHYEPLQEQPSSSSSPLSDDPHDPFIDLGNLIDLNTDHLSDLGFGHDPFLDPFEDLIATTTDPTEQLLCPERELFGRSRIDALPDLAYELFQVLDLSSSPITLFQNEHVNLAAACVRAYLQLRDTHDFFHCTVRAVEFVQFLELMQASEGDIFTLPFSSWCDGGHYEEARHRHHRHMLLVAPKGGRLQDQVWKFLRTDREDLPIDPETDRPEKGFRGHFKLHIKSPMHLVHAIGYVSKRQSRCDGTFDEKARRPVKSRQNHFWILTSLPIHFKLPLVLQWDGGFLELISQRYVFLSLQDFVPVPRHRGKDGRWQILIRDLPGIQLDRVLSVAKHLIPTKGPTDQFLHLCGGSVMYLEEDFSLVALDREAWGRAQAARGNRYYGAMGKTPWTPSSGQQKYLNAVEEYRQIAEAAIKEAEMERARREALERDLAIANETLARERAERSAVEGRLEDQIHRLKNTLRRKNAHIASLNEALALEEGLRNADEAMLATLKEMILERIEYLKSKHEARSIRIPEEEEEEEIGKKQ